MRLHVLNVWYEEVITKEGVLEVSRDGFDEVG